MKKLTFPEWIDALQSGKYKKGTEALYNRDYNEYCCLGVLCFEAGVLDDYLDSGHNSDVSSELFTPLLDEAIDHDGQLIDNFFSKLSYINDQADAWDEVIEVLKGNISVDDAYSQVNISEK